MDPVTSVAMLDAEQIDAFRAMEAAEAAATVAHGPQVTGPATPPVACPPIPPAALRAPP